MPCLLHLSLLKSYRYMEAFLNPYRNTLTSCIQKMCLTIRSYIYSRRKIKQSIGEFLAKDTNLKYTAL